MPTWAFYPMHEVVFNEVMAKFRASSSITDLQASAVKSRFERAHFMAPEAPVPPLHYGDPTKVEQFILKHLSVCNCLPGRVDPETGVECELCASKEAVVDPDVNVRRDQLTKRKRAGVTYNNAQQAQSRECFILTLKDYMTTDPTIHKIKVRLGIMLPANTPVALAQENPKDAKRGSWERYEKYKTATTLEELKDRGAKNADMEWDLFHGFLKIGKAALEPQAMVAV